VTVTFALVGPTASGKTTIALDLAERFGAEIVCVDSMTVYRGMDIGTAKPTPEQRARVPHHLLDVADPAETFTVARFQQLARAAIHDIRARGRVPLLAGGSGLYFRAAVDDLTFPPTDVAVRTRLDRRDIHELAVMLKEADETAATFIDLENRRRVVRALEVIEITGRPFSSFRDEWQRRNPAIVAGIRVSTGELATRIEQRVRDMLEGGFLDEVRLLVDRGLRDALTASQAIAYGQAVAHLDGKITREELIAEAARATRRLARRQMSWFRRDPRMRWFEADDVPRATQQISAYYGEEVARSA